MSDSQQRASEDPFGPIEGTWQQEPLPSSSIAAGMVRSERLLDLQRQLERARASFLQGNHQESRAILEFVLPLLERTAETAKKDAGQVSLMLAAALGLQGRLDLAAEDEARAAMAFDGARDLFAEWMEWASGMDFSDYGIVLYLTDDTPGAIEELRRGVDLGYANGETYLYLGLALEETQAYGEAADFLRKATELASNDYRALEALARVLLAQGGREAEATQALKRAAAANADAGRLQPALDLLYQVQDREPADVESLAAEARILRALDRPREALPVLERAVQLVEDDPWLWYEVGLTREALEEPEPALEAYGRAHGLAPAYAQPMLRQAAVLRRLGRASEAVDLLREGVEVCPQPPVWVALAEQLKSLGRPGEALVAVDQARQIQAGDAAILALRGELLRRLRRFDEAQQDLAAALSLQPDNAHALGEQALVIAEWERDDRALKAITTALQDQPDHPTLLGYQGDVLLLLDRRAQAVKVLVHACELESGQAWLWTGLCRAYHWEDRYQDALEAVERALALEPQYVDALLRKASVLRWQEQWQDALQVAEQAVDLSLGLPQALAEQGLVLAGLGRLEDGLTLLSQAVERAPDDPWVLGVMGALLRQQGRPEEALPLLHEALEQRPAHEAGVLLEQGYALMDLERYQEAVEAFDRALDHDPGSLEALWAKGEALRLLQDFRRAVRLLRKVLRKDPQHVSALRSLGYTWLALEEPDQALECFQQAEAARPQDPGVLGDLALWYQMEGLYQEALIYLQKALAESPENAWALARFADALCDVAAYEHAIAALDRIEEPTWETYFTKGWAFENLADSRQAEECYRIALEALPRAAEALFEEPSYPVEAFVLAGLANALYLAGPEESARREEARQTYQRVLSLVRDYSERKGQVDADLLNAAGWANYRLERHDEAVRLLNEALSLYPERLSTRFDLALALLCGGYHDDATGEYWLVLQEMDAQLRDPLRCRGLLHVALADLREAHARRPDLPAASIEVVLQQRFQEVNDQARGMLAEILGA